MDEQTQRIEALRFARKNSDGSKGPAVELAMAVRASEWVKSTDHPAVAVEALRAAADLRPAGFKGDPLQVAKDCYTFAVLPTTKVGNTQAAPAASTGAEKRGAGRGRRR